MCEAVDERYYISVEWSREMPAGSYNRRARTRADGAATLWAYLAAFDANALNTDNV